MAKKLLLIISLTSMMSLNYGSSNSTNQSEFEKQFRQKYAHLDIPSFDSLSITANPTSKYEYPALERQILSQIHLKQNIPYFKKIGHISNALAASVLSVPVIHLIKPQTVRLTISTPTVIAASIATALVPRIITGVNYFNAQADFVDKHYQPTAGEKEIAEIRETYKHIPQPILAEVMCHTTPTQIMEACK